MSELPEGWAHSRLGPLIELNPKSIGDENAIAGFVPMTMLGTDFHSPVRYETRIWSDIKKGYTHFCDGDVLLAKITPCFENGKAGLVEGMPNAIGAGSTEYFVCRPITQLLTPRYLLAFFKTANFLSVGATQMTGSVGHKRVPKDYLLDAEIPLPPLPEQTRIANKLDTLLARVDSARDRLDLVPGMLKRFRQAVLTAATSGVLTEAWRGEQNLPGLRTVKLLAAADGFSYGSASKSEKTGTVPVLRMGNIQNGRLDWDDLVFTSDKSEIAKYQLQAGDVLFNRTNSPELVGKSSIFRGERPAIYAGYLIRVRCNPTLLPDFLNYCLGSPAGRDYCWQVKSDGVSQSNINAKKLAAFEFLLPSLPEQIEIVRQVEILFAYADRLEARLKTARKLSESLSPAILAKAFRGELVAQDPNDEPAVELLKRIRAGRK